MHRKIAALTLVTLFGVGALLGCSKNETTTTGSNTGVTSGSSGDKKAKFDASGVTQLDLMKCVEVASAHLELLTPKDEAAAKAAADKLKKDAPQALYGDIDTVAAAKGELMKIGTPEVSGASDNISAWIQKACPSS